MKKGFSLMETVIAMMLITIASACAVSAVLTAANLRHFASSTKFFVSEVGNYLECYKVSGSDGFEDNVTTYLGINLPEPTPEGEGRCYDLYYTGSFASCAPESAVYQLRITLSDGFYARVRDIKNEKDVYRSTESYVSRFDLPGSAG